MSDLVRYDLRNRVAVVTIDNPPVNALSPAVWEGIEAAVFRSRGPQIARSPAYRRASRGRARSVRRMRQSLATTARGMAAPSAAVETIEAGLKSSFDAGSMRERELFAECVVSIESRALRHLFFAEREAAKVPGVPKATPARDITRAAVVGAGTMGGGIAMSYANAGIPVLLKDVDDDALQRGLGTIRKNYGVTMAKGKMTPEQVEKTLALITPTTTYDGFDRVDIVVEVVFENMDLKKSTFAELGAVTRPDCVMASNASTLDIDEFARASTRPGQVLGHHFFSPANVMKLLEIVRGRETSAEVIATSLRLAKKLNKVGVVVDTCQLDLRPALQFLRSRTDAGRDFKAIQAATRWHASGTTTIQ